ncbi:MAG: hypothetical protein AAB634_02645 [Patescibacteria group bacterium]
MKEQIAQTQHWLRRVQRSGENTKRVWLFTLSALAMLLVISLWFLYVSFTMPRIGGERLVPAEDGEASFFGVMKEGARVMAKEFWGELQGAREGLGNIREKVEGGIRNYSN